MYNYELMFNNYISTIIIGSNSIQLWFVSRLKSNNKRTYRLSFLVNSIL